MPWALQDAKNHFSKVVQRAQTEGAQVVTVRGQRTAVILSAADYDRLCAGHPSLVDHLLSGPVWDDELASAIDSRSKTPSRKVEL
jgi:prevent-host-death family protein